MVSGTLLKIRPSLVCRRWRRDNLNGWDRQLNNWCRFETLAINDDG